MTDMIVEMTGPAGRITVTPEQINFYKAKGFTVVGEGENEKIEEVSTTDVPTTVEEFIEDEDEEGE